MLSAELLKVVVLFTLLVATFFFSMLPLIIQRLSSHRHFSSQRRRFYRAVVSILSCFAAGVFIGICLLDLFPEVERNINSVLTKLDITSTFPLPEFVIVLGFLLLLAVEQFVLTWKSQPRRGDQFGPLLSDCDSLSSSYSSVGASRLPEVPNVRFGSADPLDSPSDGIGTGNDDDDNDERTGDQSAYTDPNSHSVIRSFILLVALSLHSLFEGLAVGLQSTINDTLRLFIALALHKCIIAFSIGLNMVQSKLSPRAIIFSNVIFSLASPIGISIGIGIVDVWNSGGVVASGVIGTLQGLACGTFIYVVFFEILPHEFMKKRLFSYPSRMLKVFSLLVGYAVIVGVLFLDPDV